MPEWDHTDFKGHALAEADKEQRSRAAAANERDHIRWIMDGPKGRWFVQWVLNKAHVDDECYSSNALEMSKLNGRRGLGVEIKRLVEALCPDQYDLMRKERRNGRSRHDQNS